MKLYPDKDYISKRLKRQEGWLDYDNVSEEFVSSYLRDESFF